MMIIDPVSLGDVACTRASPAPYYDRSGVQQLAPANTLRVSYDPSDLSKPPFALVELAAATNLALYSEQLDNAAWTKFNWFVTPNAAQAPDGTLSADLIGPTSGTSSFSTGVPAQTIAKAAAPVTYTLSAFVKAAGGATSVRICPYGGNTANTASCVVDLASGAILAAPSATGTFSNPSAAPAQWIAACGMWRVNLSFTSGPETDIRPRFFPYNGLNPVTGDGAVGLYLWGVMLNEGALSSYVATTGAAATRAADAVAAGAGLVASNVAITEPDYSAGATFALGVVVHEPATHLTYQSLIANNTGHALTDTSAWTPRKKMTNRWLMFDTYNNTQTEAAEEIVVCVSPQAICQGLYLGNIDATEVRISVVDLADGLVYSETQSLVVPNSGSSFYNWCFKRITRKTYAVSIQLPPYANALITIAIKKPGSTAKCGACVVGPLVDVGLSQYGLGREIKDYSTINFNFDGTSNQVVRNFAKRMDLDVSIDNSMIDYVIETLEGYRQKPVAWVGAKEFGSACVFGRCSAFKNVIESYPFSKMNLQIEGTV